MSNLSLERRGRITASAVHKLMGKSLDTDTTMTYIYSLVMNELGVESDEVSSAATDWGHIYESVAKEYYMIATGADLLDSDFIICEENNEIGCTPDALEVDKDTAEIDTGLEIKCPFNPVNHLENLLIKTQDDLKKQRKEYYWQIQMQMYVCKKDRWKFISFDPRYTGAQRMFVLNVVKNESDIELIKARIKGALKIKKELLSQLKK